MAGTALALVLVGSGLVGCGTTASHVYDPYPYLEPGRTDADAVLRMRRRDVAPGGDAAGDAAASADRPVPDRSEPDARPIASLADAVSLLLEHSPTVAASRQRYKAAVERVPQASKLPDPQLRYTYLPWPVETRVGPNEHRVMLQQMIPFPSKLVARHDAASAEARAAAVRHDATVRDEITRLKVLWADLYYFARALDVVTQNEGIARTLSEVAAERYGAESGQLFDVSKAQSQLAQLGYDRIKLTEMHETVRAELNAVLGRPAQAPIEPPNALPLVVLAVPEERLFAVAVEHQQELRALDEEIRAADARLSEARSGWLPDLTLGVEWMGNGPARMPNVADSGDDALGVMIGLSLPLWFTDNAAAVREADARLTAKVLEKKAHIDQLEAAVRRLVFEERDARRLRVLYDEELLPQAVASLATSEQWYRADAARFTDFLEARAVYYSFALARERAVADHFQTIARLERLIGATLAAAQEGEAQEGEAQEGAAPLPQAEGRE